MGHFSPIQKDHFVSIPRVPIRRGPVFANLEGSYLANPEESQFVGVLFLAIRRSANSEGSCFCQSEGVIFCQSEGVPIRRSPVFAKPEGSYFCQSGRVILCQCGGVPFQRGVIFVDSEGS